MAGPGRPRKIVEESGIIEAETPSSMDAVINETPSVNTAVNDCWRYHATEKPRLFRMGDIIPAGWEDEDMIGWKPDSEGNWTRK
jgi:hypothetical protein